MNAKFKMARPVLGFLALTSLVIVGLGWFGHWISFAEKGTASVSVSVPMDNEEVLGLSGLGVTWLVTIILLVAVGYRLFSALSPLRQERFWKFVDDNIKWCFLIVWIFGFLTYCIGTYVGPHALNKDAFLNLLSVVPMAIIHATEMFLGQSDISAIRGGQHDNSFFMFCFNLSHILAILCSMVFVLLQFGFFMESQIRLWIHSHKKVSGNLYIFWGLNERSLLLAESISKKIREDEEKERRGETVPDSESGSKVLFVRTYDDSDSHSSNISFARLLSMVKLKNNEIDQLRRLGCYVTTAFHQLTDAEIKMEDGKVITTDILGTHLHAGSLMRIIGNTSGEIHFFMLNEDEDVNLNCTRRIVNDKTINEINNPVIVHCYAHKTHEARMEEEELDIYNAQKSNQSERHIEVKILDTSALAVNLLKSDVTHHPISFVEINTTTNPGTVTSRFHALVVGFGETGRNAFRFLYEYGAFLDESSSDTDTKRSEFSCDIVDANYKEINAYFKKTRPVTTQEDWEKAFEGRRNQKICGYNTDYKSDTFYHKVLSEENLQSLNYVVISLGNDEEGLTLALKILQEAQRVKDSMAKFRIYLRVFDANRAKEIRHVVNHYNDVYREESVEGDLIVLFGDPDEIFTYDIIVRNKFQQESMVYYYYYRQLEELMRFSAPNPLKTLKDKVTQEGLDFQGARRMWEERHNKALQRDKNKMLPIGKIRSLRRKESQDLANAYHRHTKMYIINKVKEAANPDEAALARLYENIAITEHLRWNAAHEMLGYVLDKNGTGCDDMKKRHNCLVAWEKLDDVSNRANCNYKHYDRIVVSTSELLMNIE